MLSTKRLAKTLVFSACLLISDLALAEDKCLNFADKLAEIFAKTQKPQMEWNATVTDIEWKDPQPNDKWLNKNASQLVAPVLVFEVFDFPGTKQTGCKSLESPHGIQFDIIESAPDMIKFKANHANSAKGFRTYAEYIVDNGLLAVMQGIETMFSDPDKITEEQIQKKRTSLIDSTTPDIATHFSDAVYKITWKDQNSFVCLSEERVGADVGVLPLAEVRTVFHLDDSKITDDVSAPVKKLKAIADEFERSLPR